MAKNIELVQINNKDWTEIQGFSSKGRRVKSWYERVSSREVFLYKEPKIYSSTNFVTKEIWTEYIAYKLGTFLGLNIPEAIPATDGEHYGILIKSFLERGEAGMPAIELAEASDILHHLNSKQPHNLSTIKLLLHTEMLEKDSWENFKRMLIFDCLIGNNDRHDENWGLLYGSAISQIRLAPIYDNASCLTSGENEEKVEKLLQNETMLNQYINNSKPPNLYLNTSDSTHYKHFEIIQYLIDKEQNSTVDLIGDIVKKDYLSYTKYVLEQIHHIDVPDLYKLSDNRVELIYKILELRKKKLEELINVYI